MSLIKEDCECDYCKRAEGAIDHRTRKLIFNMPISEKEKLQLIYDTCPSSRRAHDDLKRHNAEADAWKRRR